MVFLFFLFTAPNSVAEKSENEILKNTDEIFKKLWQSDKPLPLIDFYVENKKLYGDEVWLFFMKKLISEDNCLINEKNDEISCKKIKDDGL